jgi:predicted metalloenzyme YecM
MKRPEQSGVAGCNITASILTWTCAGCEAVVEVPYSKERQLMPEGWTHVMIQVPGVNRVSLYCDACARSMTLADVRERERAAHEAWLAEETRWIAEQLKDSRAALEAERARIEAELEALKEP